MLKRIVLLIMLFISIATAKELQVVFTYTTPPFVFKDGTGIVIDIVKESLAYRNYTVKPLFVNIGRGFEMFKNGYVDATSLIKKSSGLKAYYSEPFMQYHNIIISLKSNHYKVKNLSDLKSYYFIAFQNAKVYLGKEFEEVSKQAGDKYSEIADQKSQVYKLFMGRTDFIVMDRHIFEYYKNELIYEDKVSKDIKVSFFEPFEPTKYRTAFKDKKVRDDFNIGLKYLKETNRYDKIYDDYSSKYFKVKK